MAPKDPAMLLSFVNMRLRDEYENLDELCAALNLDKTEITEKLAAIDYHYDTESNQFK
uniref:DUF4250 domain-containing protein n=1 Tax=Eubacterium cellulosolvens (strain ATCC 43171 / JCM 9499 / 6) TaxID=633697 RepID=I5ATK2_EUBC6